MTLIKLLTATREHHREAAMGIHVPGEAG